MEAVLRYTDKRADDKRNFMTFCANLVLHYHDPAQERAEVYSEALTAMAFLSRLAPSFNAQDPSDFFLMLTRPVNTWLSDGPDVTLIRDSRPTKDCKILAKGFGLEPQ